MSLEEALARLDIVEEDGLLHTWQNNSELTGMTVSCQCCRDCCVAVGPLDAVGAPLSKIWAKSSFEASIDAERCDGCQDCVERCHFDAITMVVPPAGNGLKKASKKLKALVDPENCWGCGLCVLVCDKVDAIEITRGKDAMRFVKKDSVWMVEKPTFGRADSSAVDGG